MTRLIASISLRPALPPWRLLILALFLALITLPACQSADSPTASPTSLPYPSAPAILERRELTLDYPESIRLGEAGTLRLDFASLEDVSHWPAPNVFDTHHVLAEARLEIPGALIRPAETVSEPLLPGQAARFFWSVEPLASGELEGTVWFYLRFIPKEAGGEEGRMAISAQKISIRVDSAGRAPWWLIRLGGILGLVAGLWLAWRFWRREPGPEGESAG